MISERRCFGCYGIRETKHTTSPKCKAKCADCYHEGENMYRCKTCRHGEGRTWRICNFRWKGPKK